MQWTTKYVALVFVLVVFPVTPVLSLHEMDHRYDITGYVLDAQEQPIPGVAVVAHLGGERLGSGRSDSNGNYRFRVHLHDSDLGRELRLKTPDSQGSVRVTFTRGDTSTERIHHVNFIGGKLVEGAISGRGGISSAMIVAAALSVALLGSIIAGRHLRRMRRRRKRAEEKAAQAQGRSAAHRRKRKKRGR